LPKNITLSISDELAEKMDTMPEINWSEVCRQAISKYIDERKSKEKGELIKELEIYLSPKLTESEEKEGIKRAEIERFTKKWGEPEILSEQYLQKPHIRLRKIQDIKMGDTILATLKIYNDVLMTTTNITPSRLLEFDAERWKNVAQGKLDYIVDYFKSKGFTVGECGELTHVQLTELVTNGDKDRATAIIDQGYGLFALDKEDLVFLAYRSKLHPPYPCPKCGSNNVSYDCKIRESKCSNCKHTWKADNPPRY
jgi:hypothetical protein